LKVPPVAPGRRRYWPALPAMARGPNHWWNRCGCPGQSADFWTQWVSQRVSRPARAEASPWADVWNPRAQQVINGFNPWLDATSNCW